MKVICDIVFCKFNASEKGVNKGFCKAKTVYLQEAPNEYLYCGTYVSKSEVKK